MDEKSAEMDLIEYFTDEPQERGHISAPRFFVAASAASSVGIRRMGIHVL